DFHVTTLAVYTMSAFFGSTFTSAKSDSRDETRVSGVARYQFSPASSERWRPAFRFAPTVANMRDGMDGATVMPIRPRPSCSNVGKPLPPLCQVSPPSVDLNKPLPGPENCPFSHGPCRDSQSTA